MTHPFFCIIIPTRQRHETLPFSIKTVLCQDFLDYELIIFDNCSSSETHDAVKLFQDDRIKYFRSDIPLAMSDSWESAVSKASGQYVILFGDDDGLIQGSLKFLYKILQKFDYSVIRWDFVRYNWPCVQPSQWANQLLVPLFSRNKEYLSNNTISRVLDSPNEFAYMNLPMLYNSVVSKKLLDELKNISGRIFCSITPDVYSGFAIAYLSRKYLSIKNPITITGSSKKSNGISHITMKADNDIIQDFEKLNKSSHPTFHKDVPYVRTFLAAVYECFLQMQENLNAKDIKPNKNKIYRFIASTIKVADEYEKEQLEIIIQNFKKNSVYGSLFEKIILKTPTIQVINLESITKFKVGISSEYISVDASQFNLSNVFDISKFVANYYDFQDENFYVEDINSDSRSRRYLRKIKIMLESIVNRFK